MENQRILWADSLKGWLMLIVILGHAIQVGIVEECENNHIWNIIYSFHMPAFIAVSGWFAYRSNRNQSGYRNVVVRRCAQLLVPFFIWSLVGWVIDGFKLVRLLEIIMYPDTTFWFLWALFWICCIFTLCQWIADRLHVDELIPVCISCVVLVGIKVSLDFSLFGYPLVSYYFIFYTLGYCIHRFPLLQIKNNISLVVLTCVWAFLAWFWNMHELPSWMPAIPHLPSSLLQSAYKGLTAVLAILVVFGVAPKVLNGENKFNGWIKDVGVVSLGLYVCHWSFMHDIKKAILYIFPDLSIWSCIACTFVVSFIISFAIVKLLMMQKWTARLFLGKI